MLFQRVLGGLLLNQMVDIILNYQYGINMKYGDNVTDDCEKVGKLLPRQMKKDVSDKLQPDTGSGATSRGKLFVASRKDDYKSLFRDKDLDICNMDDISSKKLLRLKLKNIHECLTRIFNMAAVAFSDNPFFEEISASVSIPPYPIANFKGCK